MRTASANFNYDQLAEAVKRSHQRGVSVYVTCNTLPRNEELARLPEFLQHLQQIGADAVIVADFGILQLAKQHAPKLDVHISTQAGICLLYTSRCV